MATEAPSPLNPPASLTDVLRLGSSALRSAGVPFALAGGLAVNVWGRERLTTDVDFTVTADSVEALTSLVERLQSYGFLALDPRPMEFRRAWVGRLVTIPPSSGGSSQPLIVDLLRPVGRGADWWVESIFRRVSDVTFLGEPMPVVSAEDLVLFKVMIQEDRGYDLDDARSVIGQVGAAFDRRYAIDAARRLGVRGRLKRVGV